jgi:hypothetical protein
MMLTRAHQGETRDMEETSSLSMFDILVINEVKDLTRKGSMFFADRSSTIFNPTQGSMETRP